MNHKELFNLTKERGVYQKDAKKHEMALALRKYDHEKKAAEHDAIVQRERGEQEERRAQKKRDEAKQAALKAQHERRMLKENKIKRGESVSEDSLDEEQLQAEHDRLNGRDDYNQEKFGQVLSDESWDSTSTESSVYSTNPPILPDCRVRLYEWPYSHLPEAEAPMPTPKSVFSFSPEYPELLPVPVSYAPMKMITVNSNQKMFLPGQRYPRGVNPDFVPFLSSQTRQAARNGILQDVLAKATIERATEWSTRTLVQGWNARIFFTLPPRNETKELADVYRKWRLETRKLLKVKGRQDTLSANRASRHAQHQRNKALMAAEVYEASQYRPLAMVYIPAYLDYESQTAQSDICPEESDRSLANLFYVRFPSCDVPHYYFWTGKGEWEDPTVPNPSWNPDWVQQNSTDTTNAGCLSEVQHAQKQPWKAPTKTMVRVKRPDVTFDPPLFPLSSNNFDAILANIEQSLCSYGLAVTLANCRSKCIADGKSHAWKVFAHALPQIYPAGQLASAPPIDAYLGESIAMKLATIEALAKGEDNTPLSPFRGDESWTENDDAYWDVKEVDDIDSVAHTKEDIQRQLERSAEGDAQTGALYRRSSTVIMNDRDNVEAWLASISPSQAPPTSIDDLLLGESTWYGEQEAGPFLASAHKVSTICPFCSLQWQALSDKVCCILIMAIDELTKIGTGRAHVLP